MTGRLRSVEGLLFVIFFGVKRTRVVSSVQLEVFLWCHIVC